MNLLGIRPRKEDSRLHIIISGIAFAIVLFAIIQNLLS